VSVQQSLRHAGDFFRSRPRLHDDLTTRAGKFLSAIFFTPARLRVVPERD
jgi:hypothetical protein